MPRFKIWWKDVVTKSIIVKAKNAEEAEKGWLWDDESLVEFISDEKIESNEFEEGSAEAEETKGE